MQASGFLKTSSVPVEIGAWEVVVEEREKGGGRGIGEQNPRREIGSGWRCLMAEPGGIRKHGCRGVGRRDLGS